MKLRRLHMRSSRAVPVMLHVSSALPSWVMVAPTFGSLKFQNARDGKVCQESGRTLVARPLISILRAVISIWLSSASTSCGLDQGGILEGTRAR
jgi:hypothetical protein